MAAAQQREEFLEQEPFRRNAFLIIDKMVKLNSEHANIPLVDEILHSIFFLGKINKIPFSPEDILSDDEDLLNALKDLYPQPFKLYYAQLPRRSPFSCVLDMIVYLTRQTHQGKRQEQEIEKEIIEKLRQLIGELELGKNEPLVSSTICVSHSPITPNAVRYYGVSMSTSGRNPGKILIAASCFSSWDSYVAGAVMTYYPNKVKREYFDGTIILPEQHVRCQAFNLFEERDKPPCRSCGNLFGLTTNEKKEWPYGNCAEAESVSNLLTNVVEIREQARPKAETCTEENRKRAEGSVRKELEGFVRTERFKWGGQFYTPQRV